MNEREGKEPREKKKKGGVWGKLKEVGAPDREKHKSGGNGEIISTGEKW
jgi:hypothetical protein